MFDAINGFTKAAFSFFSDVLKEIRFDDLLRLLWGVEVLLFVILVFMSWFGDLTREQRFVLALFIVASVVFTFVVTAWRRRPTEPRLIEQVQNCLTLLTQIRDANARIIRRGRSGNGPWAKILNDTYNRVCDTCHRRRLGTEPSDAYFDVICAEADVKTVCERKWELGEALDVYRSYLNRASPLPPDHDDLERFIRQSVTQPNLSPPELETAVGQAIERAKRIRP